MSTTYFSIKPNHKWNWTENQHHNSSIWLHIISLLTWILWRSIDLVDQDYCIATKPLALNPTLLLHSVFTSAYTEVADDNMLLTEQSPEERYREREELKKTLIRKVP